MLNFDPSLWPHPTFGRHDFYNFNSLLPDDATTQVSAFLANWFRRRRFLKINSLCPYVKLRPPIVTKADPWGSQFSQL